MDVAYILHRHCIFDSSLPLVGFCGQLCRNHTGLLETNGGSQEDCPPVRKPCGGRMLMCRLGDLFRVLRRTPLPPHRILPRHTQSSYRLVSDGTLGRVLTARLRFVFTVPFCVEAVHCGAGGV